MAEKKQLRAVRASKKRAVTALVNKLKEYKIIGLLNLDKMPSNQLQTIRSNIRKDITLLMVKLSIMERAFKEAGCEELLKHVQGKPSLLLTNSNPFKVYKIIEKNKSKTPIKAGQRAPFDLVIPQGDTPFTPGPIIGELGVIGVKAKVDKGKIIILKDAVVTKKDDVVSGPVSSMLLKLGVKPIEIGLNVVAIKEGKNIYTKDVLSTDFESMLSKAFINAKNLVLNTGIFEPSLINEILQKARLNALFLNGFIHPDQAIKVNAPSAQAPIKKKETKEEEEEKEENKENKDTVAALGAIFG